MEEILFCLHLMAHLLQGTGLLIFQKGAKVSDLFLWSQKLDEISKNRVRALI